MPERTCLKVQQWLQQTPADRGSLPGPDLVAHAAACPACRGLLLTAAVTLLDVPAPPAPLVCSDCEQRLDAFIDWEETYGPAAAARRYSQVWWHVLQCPDCAEVYSGVHTLLHAAASGALVMPMLPQRYPVLQLPRTYLHAALAPQLALGVSWGAEDAQQIAEVQVGPYHLALAAYPGPAATVTLLVQLDPPAPGVVEVQLDPLAVRAPFAADGIATLPDLPADLFAAAGSDLSLDLDLDEPLS